MAQEDTPNDAASWLGGELIKEGILDNEQLQRALRVQRYLEEPKQLGAVLIELGYATKQDIINVLSKAGGALRLGDLLLEQGLISQQGLEQALSLQERRGLKLGEALVEIGELNLRTLLQNLAHQTNMPYIEPMFAMIEPSVLSGVSPDYLARFGFIPFSRSEDGHVTVVVSDPHDAAALQAVDDLYKGNHSLALGPPETIRQAIDDYRRGRGDRAPHPPGFAVTADSDSVVQLLDHIISMAVEERASDIHIEPMSNFIRLRYRIDGVLVYKMDLPKDLLSRLATRLKIMAGCSISEHQRHDGGRIQYTCNGREYDLRLSSYVSVHGECMVIRILNKQMGLVDLAKLGMSRALLERYRDEIASASRGLVLFTGTSGSGKTTTLYSSLNYCNTIDVKIITAEDPVEYLVDGLIQCSISEKLGRTYEATLREISRQDPDIIVLGELPDRTAVQAAIQIALTGQKIYSTFYAEDSVDALGRLFDMDIEPTLVASSVIAIFGQRLLRRNCGACAGPYTPVAPEVEKIGLKREEVHEFELKKGRGCKLCNFTGYRGRIAVYELLLLNGPFRDAILEKQPAQTLRQMCMKSAGFLSMREDAIAKVIRGMTTFEEVLRRTPPAAGLRPLRQILAMAR